MAKRGPKIRFNDEYHRVQRELMRDSRAKKEIAEKLKDDKLAFGIET